MFTRRRPNPFTATAARAAMPGRSGMAVDSAAVDAGLAAHMTNLRLAVGALRSLLEGQVHICICVCIYIYILRYRYR